MNLFLILLLFLVWRGFDFLIIFFSQKIIPYLGFFPYSNQLPLFHLPTWVSALANFDGLHYLSIAKNGYAQYEQAFFPLYPLLIKFLSSISFKNQLLTGLIISNVSFFLGLFIFYKYLYLIRATKMVAPTAIFMILAFPTSFFLGAVYTEGLFFLLVVSALYSLKKERYLLAVIFAFLTATTRIVGVFLIIPILFHLIQKFLQLRSGQAKAKSFLYFILNTKYLILIISPFLGLASYCFYLWQTTGDAFFFFTSQPAFGASRSTHLITFFQVYWRYFKIFYTASHNIQYFVSIIEFSFFSFVLIILILDLFSNLEIKNWKLFRNLKLEIRNYDLLGLNLFSLINLILPTMTGTFLSIPRFSLMSLSVFIYLSQLKNIYLKYLMIGIFIILHILLLGYFTQGYFIS